VEGHTEEDPMAIRNVPAEVPAKKAAKAAPARKTAAKVAAPAKATAAKATDKPGPHRPQLV